MKKKEFFDQVEKRLEENKKLQEQVGLGKYIGPLSDVINERLFWVLLATSGLMTIWWVGDGLSNVGNKLFFGWLFA